MNSRSEFHRKAPSYTPADWGRFVAAHLDELGDVTPRDADLLRNACLGVRTDSNTDRMRLLALLRGARDDNGQVSIAGQVALIKAVADRVGAP